MILELSPILKFSSVLERENVDFIIEIMINDSDKNEVFDLMIEHGYNGYLITNAGLIKESRPLTPPRHDRVDRTLWRNHFFTKKPISEIKNFSNGQGILSKKKPPRRRFFIVSLAVVISVR